MFDCVEDSLELLGLFEVDLPLCLSIIFTKFLLCTTIQDSSIRERSSSHHTFFIFKSTIYYTECEGRLW